MLVKHTALNAPSRPTAYTLVELLVVLAIIVFLAGLLIVMWPGLSSSSQATRNSDSVQSMLLGARAKAMREGVPNGVRLVPDPNNPNNITQVMYVRQPPPFVPPITTLNGTTVVGTLGGSIVNQPQGVFFNFVDFTGGFTQFSDYPVQYGDYLEINGGGPLHQIIEPIVIGPTAELFFNDNITVTNPTTNWRIIRQPRAVVGEEPLLLSSKIVIDAGIPQFNAQNVQVQYSQNIPIRNVFIGVPVSYYEIMFSPSGSVMGQGTASNDKIILWVYDSSQPAPTAGSPVLIAIQVGTGLIGGYPVDVNQVGGDYYSNTRDPHASGL